MIEGLSIKALEDPYFFELFDKAEMKYASNFFNITSEKLKEKELVDLLRFGDILSRSDSSEGKNKAYKIVSLLIDDHYENPVFRFFSNSILIKLGNFPALKFLGENFGNKDQHPFELVLEKNIKEEHQKIPRSDYTFTDSQYEIFEELKNNNHFSFSGPTSLGKSFIINAFVRYLITEHKGTDNLIILVPTRALINQTVIKLKKEFSDQVNYKILAHPTVPSYLRDEDSRYIFIFTPERLIAYLSDIRNPKIDYLFVDEAQKIISENDPRSALYYHAILQAERKSIKLYFSSPNIPNPEVFLQLFEKSTDESISIKNAPVAQNRFYLDLIDDYGVLFSDRNGEETKLPLEFKGLDFFDWLVNLSNGQKSIVYCNTKADTIRYAIELADRLEEKNHEAIDEVVSILEDYLHKKYYLIECLKKGVAFHFGSLPQRIREKVEQLFTDKVIDYVFCTSTLLEGVNLPAKNIFILSNCIGLSKFEAIDFWNLAGRAGRLAQELSGNIICARIENKRGRWDNLSKDLKVVKSRDVEKIKPLVINGQKNFFKNIGYALDEMDYTQKKPSNNEINMWKHYANIALIHEVRSDDSTLRANFLKKGDGAASILSRHSKNNVVPEKILSSSSMIKAKYQNAIYKSEDLIEWVLPHEVTYDVALEALKTLSVLYCWDKEEAGGHNPMYNADGNTGVLKYYAVLMNGWMNSRPLNMMINDTFKYHEGRGVIFDEVIREDIPFNKKSKKQINWVINNLITNIDNILRFKIKNYFDNFYALSKDVLGEETAGCNWAEYLEYGTSDYRVIELQNIGIPRHLANHLLENHEDCFVFDGKALTDFMTKSLFDQMERTSAEYIELREFV